MAFTAWATRDLERVDVRVVRGREAILEVKPILDKLALLSDQPTAVRDLAYYLSTPDARKKNPCLVLVPQESGIGREGESVLGFVGAVLLFEYRILGVGSRLYSSADTTGRRAVIGPAASRIGIAAYAFRLLLERGAQMVLTSIYEPAEDSDGRAAVAKELQRDALKQWRTSACWSMVSRTNPLYLPLVESYNDTLAGIGKKTRANLRYYRRRAEKELGCTFVPDARLSVEEFLAFNRQCMFAVPDEFARWRYEAMAMIEQPFLQGIRDRHGRWLSLAGGRRLEHVTELEWQCNRADLPASSLSTVLRSYLIEHEGALGMRRLYIEGGTPSSLRQSFVVEAAADLTLFRRSAYARLVKRFAKHLFPHKNQMAQILTNRSLVWTDC